MSKAEAGNSSMFFIRHLTLLNTLKNVKFRKSFSLVDYAPSSARAGAIRSPLAQALGL
jgi:hypothetical protein